MCIHEVQQAIIDITKIFDDVYPDRYELMMSYDISNDYIHWNVHDTVAIKDNCEDSFTTTEQYRIICRGKFLLSDSTLESIVDSILRQMSKLTDDYDKLVIEQHQKDEKVNIYKCPTCGASVKYGQEECEYCKSKLTFYDD